MHALGRLEDLPPDYVNALAKHHLMPLWPALRSMLPPGIPARQTQLVHWPYAAIKPLLLRAGELTPIEKAERRVLVLTNPGHGLDSMKASPAIYLGMQLLLPGEWAPAHRHTPNAVRMIVEGTDATTTVNGECCPMERGDLILTPTGQWHEHEHTGSEPVVWLDVLDLPLMVYAEVSYAEEGQRQVKRAGRGDERYRRAGVVPTRHFERARERYPMLRYPWRDVRETLLANASALPREAPVEVTYVNPDTGEDAENNLGFYALMLRPGERRRLPARSPAQVFHVIEGGCTLTAAGHVLTLTEADTCAVPGYEALTLENASAREGCFLFVVDEAPLHRKLGVYEVRHQP
ncbi:MAG: cupin domain-containing protein [Casimicrobiaceae bacterium]|nr:cupin domain-containing protein [Casimicrobiaceae bacterium]